MIEDSGRLAATVLDSPAESSIQRAARSKLQLFGRKQTEKVRF
jgi:hypothetical protein